MKAIRMGRTGRHHPLGHLMLARGEVGIELSAPGPYEVFVDDDDP